MNDKQLFGAVLTANLININEGKFGDAARATWNKAPAIVRGVGSVPKYVGENLKSAGTSIKKFGTKKLLPTTNEFSRTNIFNRATNAARAVTRGVGTAAHVTGKAIENTGKAIQSGGDKWANIRANSLQAKKDAEALQGTETHNQKKLKIDRQQELKNKELEFERNQKIHDATTGSLVQTLGPSSVSSIPKNKKTTSVPKPTKPTLVI